MLLYAADSESLIAIILGVTTSESCRKHLHLIPPQSPFMNLSSSVGGATGLPVGFLVTSSGFLVGSVVGVVLSVVFSVLLLVGSVVGASVLLCVTGASVLLWVTGASVLL